MAFQVAGVYERLEKQLLLITDPSKYPVYLNRLIQSCRCISENRFPASVQDQTTINLLLNVSLKSHHAKQYLQYFLKQILSTLCNSVVKNTAGDHHDFILAFFVQMVQMGCEIKAISSFVSCLSLTEGDNFQLQLYLTTSRALVEHIATLSLSGVHVDLSSPMRDVDLNETHIKNVVDMSEQFIR